MFQYHGVIGGKSGGVRGKIEDLGRLEGDRGLYSHVIPVSWRVSVYIVGLRWANGAYTAVLGEACTSYQYHGTSASEAWQ